MRDAREAGLGKSDYKRFVRQVLETRDEQIRALVDSLPPEERKLVLSIVQDIRDRGGAEYSLQFAHIWEIDYKRKPVGIESFLRDDYYLGQFTETLFPKWRTDLGIVFGPGAHYVEWLMGGAIGAGKSFTAMIALTYLVYRMSCLRDPQRYYSLAHKTGTIVFGIYSVTMTQAVDVGYDYIRSFVENSPYFQENFPHNPRLKRRIDFLNADISVRVGSREFHALGQNLFALAMDEVNFMQAVSKDKKKREASNVLGQAEKIYNATITRLKSRYIRPGGYVPGMMFLISSKQDEQAFLERRKKDAADEIAAKRVYVSEYSVWEVRPKERFTMPKFYVEVGDRMYPSRILEAKNANDAVAMARTGSDVLEVPGEYKDAFIRDIEQSLRDLAGVATFGMTPLIRDRTRIFRCITDEWQHPFTKQEITISEESDTQIDSFFQPLRVFRVERSRHVPRHNPHMPRTLHIDIAFKGDSLGLACGHVAGFEQFKRFRDHDGSEYLERLPLVNIDFMLRIMPPLRGEIDLLKVQRFVQSLRDQGMPIDHITTDGYQCVAGDTRIWTARGMIPAREVRVGDVVQSRIGPRPVTKRWAFGKKPTLVVQTDDGHRVEITKNHKLEVAGRWTWKTGVRRPVWEWRKAGDLRVGDVVRAWDGDTTTDVAEELSLKPRTPDKRDTSYTVDWKTPKTLTAYVAEALGLLYGDGSLDSQSVTITCSCRADAVDASKVFRRAFGMELQIRGRHNHWVATRTCRSFVRWLRDNDFDKKGIPESIRRSAITVQSAFIRGLFATDGSLKARDGQPSLSTVHHDWAVYVQDFLRMAHGLPSTITHMKRTGNHYKTNADVQYVVGVRGSRRKFQNAIGFTYRSKAMLLEHHANVPGRQIWTKIASITPSAAEVFDFAVAEDHAYLANGLVSHNSTYLMQLFRKLGFKTTVLSMDRNDEPYMILKQATYDRRVRFYRHEWFLTELSRLERNLDERTVDHPNMFDENTPGSKDVADAVCGVLYHCTINPDLSLGISGVDAGAVASGIGTSIARDILSKPGPSFNPDVVRQRLRSLRNST